MKRNSKQNKSGFADTKRYPHKGHPANYRRTGRDSIEYITFTHTPDIVKINGKEYKVIPLTSNIDPYERKTTKNKSYAIPKKFIGKRSALGEEKYNLSFVKKDKKIVDNLFKELPTENVIYSKNKKKK